MGKRKFVYLILISNEDKIICSERFKPITRFNWLWDYQIVT